MDPMSLPRLFSFLNLPEPLPPLPVRDLTNDSRLVKPGAVFFAVPGYRTDGHRYIAAAVRAGAIAVVAQRPTANLPVPQIIVASSRRVQAKAAAIYFGFPSAQLTLVGITGTNGKTTSSFMLDEIFRAAGCKTGLIGTLFNKVGDLTLPTVNTSPDSILCQRLLADMAAAGVTHAAMEVSSHAMVMNRVDAVRFALGAITNFSPDHLDLHRSVAKYAQAKKDFFDLLGANSIAVVNLDDPDCIKIAGETTAPTFYYSLVNPSADVYLAVLQKDGPRALATVGYSIPRPGSLSFSFQPPGRHNLANGLLAVTVALALGIDPAAISEGLSNYRGIFRRLETIYDGDYRVIDDAAHNPSNLEAVFQALAGEKTAGVAVVYAIRGNRGVPINQANAATLAFWAKELDFRPLIITSCTDTAAPADTVLPAEAEVFRTTLASLPKVIFTDQLQKAVALAIESMAPGKTLLLLGAHPMDEVATLFARLAGVAVFTQPRPPPFGAQALDN